MNASRLSALAERVRDLSPDPLVVLYKLPNGEERTGTVTEMEESGGSFVQVCDGNSLRDLDRILQKIRDYAEEERN